MSKVLSLQAIKIIESQIDKLFDRAKARYLGPKTLPVPKRIYAGYRPEFSLPGLFNGGAAQEHAIPNEDTLKALIRNANNYLDAYRASTKAQVVKEVHSFLHDAARKGVDTDLETVLEGNLTTVWGKVTSDIKRLVDTEGSNARNLGVLDGIIKVNASQGIEDPVMFFVVVRDDSLCVECKRLHLREDGVTPRCWYLSEIGAGYHKKGQDSPKMGGLHPHCRCLPVTMMPSYGFDAEGMVKYIGEGHDEIKAQRG